MAPSSCLMHIEERNGVGDDIDEETMMIDEGLGWIQVRRKMENFGESVKIEWMLWNFSWKWFIYAWLRVNYSS